MQTLRKHALIALGVSTLASFANIANAANPLEQINQEVDKNAIVIAADTNALDAARATDNIDIIFGFAAPVV